MDPRLPCPCSRENARKRPLAYAQCCGRYLDDFDRTPAPDAESLMRSRYTAFVLQDAGYVLATWHPDKRPRDFAFDAGAKWLGLQVRGHRTLGQGHAEVEFIARYRLAGRPVRLHERSRFVQEDGRWFYLDGETQ